MEWWVMVDTEDTAVEAEVVDITTLVYRWHRDLLMLPALFTRREWGKCDRTKDRIAVVTTRSAWAAATTSTIGIKH